jgi:hypothetical protein
MSVAGATRCGTGWIETKLELFGYGWLFGMCRVHFQRLRASEPVGAARPGKGNEVDWIEIAPKLGISQFLLLEAARLSEEAHAEAALASRLPQRGRPAKLWCATAGL